MAPLGGALLELGGDRVRGPARQTLTESERRAPGGTERERGQPCGPGDRALRHHRLVVTHASSSPVIRPVWRVG